jgi:hypothetical protein
VTIYTHSPTLVNNTPFYAKSAGHVTIPYQGISLQEQIPWVRGCPESCHNITRKQAYSGNEIAVHFKIFVMAVHFKIFQPQVVADNFICYLKSEDDLKNIIKTYKSTYGEDWKIRQSAQTESENKRFLFNSRDIPAEVDGTMVPFVNIGKFVSVQRLVTRAV